MLSVPWPGHGSTLHHLPQGWGRALVVAIWNGQRRRPAVDMRAALMHEAHDTEVTPLRKQVRRAYGTLPTMSEIAI
jgi:hypothetical protein